MAPGKVQNRAQDFNNDGLTDVIRRVEVCEQTHSEERQTNGKVLRSTTVSTSEVFKPFLKQPAQDQDLYVDFDLRDPCKKEGELPVDFKKARYLMAYGRRYDSFPFYGSERETPFYVGQQVRVKRTKEEQIIKAFQNEVTVDYSENYHNPAVIVEPTKVLLENCEVYEFDELEWITAKGERVDVGIVFGLAKCFGRSSKVCKRVEQGATAAEKGLAKFFQQTARKMRKFRGTEVKREILAKHITEFWEGQVASDGPFKSLSYDRSFRNAVIASLGQFLGVKLVP